MYVFLPIVFDIYFVQKFYVTTIHETKTMFIYLIHTPLKSILMTWITCLDLVMLLNNFWRGVHRKNPMTVACGCRGMATTLTSSDRYPNEQFILQNQLQLVDGWSSCYDGHLRRPTGLMCSKYTLFIFRF